MQHIYHILLFILVPLHLSAQSTIDWILDPVGSAESYVTKQVNNVAHEVWEGFLEDNIKSSLSEDALKIANYEIDSTHLLDIDRQYKQYSYGEPNYNKANEELGKALQKFIYATPKGNLDAYAKGALAKDLQQRAENIKSAQQTTSRLSLLFLTHPELSDLNNNWKKINSLYNNISQLYYWGILSKEQTFSCPRKYKLTPTNQLVMGNGLNGKEYTVTDPESSTMIAKIAQKSSTPTCLVYVKNIAMLNHAGMPNATYLVDNITYTTDKLGRIISVQQVIDSEYKHKSSMRVKCLKPKTFVTDSNYQPYALANLKYNGTISYRNIIPIKNSKENKQQLNELKKGIKQGIKDVKSFSITTTIEYNDTRLTPKNIKIRAYNTTISLH